MTARHDVGSAAEEAVRLLGAVEDWVRERGSTLLDADHLATGSRECQVCPLCQAVGAARHVRPETVEHLLDAAASLVAALRSGLAPSGDGPRPDAASRVERIDVTEA